ncbi:MAG: glycosyl hydrolase family 28-related protein, partial [Geminicoccaceae bacterium]
MAIIDITQSPHNAAGDGATDDSAAISGAISAASEGDVIYAPRGTYETDPIAMPSGKSLTILGDGPQATVFRTRTNDTDLFIADRGTAVAEDRFENQHFYENFAAVLRTSGSDTAPNFNRCTARGAPIGCAAIVYT